MGNLESFKVEEHVDLSTCRFSQRTACEHFLVEALTGLKLGDFIKVLTSFKLDVLDNVFGSLCPEETELSLEEEEEFGVIFLGLLLGV